LSQDSDLTQKPIPTLIRTIAVSAIIGFFFNVMYHVVDTYYGGQMVFVNLTELKKLNIDNLRRWISSNQGECSGS